MSNPIFDAMRPNPMGNMMQAFQQFKSTFTGNPKQQVEQLLSSGRMSQQQFNQYSQMANQFKQFFK